MELIRPFAGLRPSGEFAKDVAAPPYDVLSTEEARVLAAGKPLSFLHISKPEIDLPSETDPYSDAVYQKGKENLASLIQQGVLQQDNQPCYYLYRMEQAGISQTGLVAIASALAYEKNDIRKHELTRPDKENDRIRMIETMNTQASPVLLTCKPNPAFETLSLTITQREPASDVVSEVGVRHTLWVVDSEAEIQSISTLFNPVGDAINEQQRLYIADGHHRSAAAAKIAMNRAESDPNYTPEKSVNFFLAVIYPSNQMHILDYNRVVTDLNGLSATAFLQQLETVFQLIPSPVAYKPQRTKEFGVYLDGKWYQAVLKPAVYEGITDPSEALDVSLLFQSVLRPILGIEDQRRDKRIDFVGGIRGMAELEKRVNSGEMAVAFSVYPTQMAQIIEVADANKIMPPKSTWFEPKLVDGLISHILD